MRAKQLYPLSVYKAVIGLSTAWHSTVQQGYLMIELMIALCTVALCSVAIAHMQSLITKTQQEAKQYLEAVNYANIALKLSKDSVNSPNPYTTTFVEYKDETIPYVQRSVIVSWKTECGISKQIKIYNGMVDTNG